MKSWDKLFVDVFYHPKFCFWTMPQEATFGAVHAEQIRLFSKIDAPRAFSSNFVELTSVCMPMASYSSIPTSSLQSASSSDHLQYPSSASYSMMHFSASTIQSFSLQSGPRSLSHPHRATSRSIKIHNSLSIFGRLGRTYLATTMELGSPQTCFKQQDGSASICNVF